jgi:hypothetical protein
MLDGHVGSMDGHGWSPPKQTNQRQDPLATYPPCNHNTVEGLTFASLNVLNPLLEDSCGEYPTPDRSGCGAVVGSHAFRGSRQRSGGARRVTALGPPARYLGGGALQPT